MAKSLGSLDPDRVAAGHGEGRRGRPHVLLVIGPAEPRPGALRAAAWLGCRLGAAMLVTSALEYRPPRDELVSVRIASVADAITATTSRLAREGVDATGHFVLAHEGYGPEAIEDLADRHEADLVAVTSARGSWFRVFPGSGLAHYLTRVGKRPVLVIPDRGPHPWTRLRAWLGERRQGAARTEAEH